MTEYIIGIDGGGTKTDGLCSDTSGHVLTRATTGPTSLTATSLGMASLNLVETFRQLTAQLTGETYFPKVVIGVAGLDTPEEKQRAEDVFRDVLTAYHIGSLTIVNDIQLVLAAGAKAPNVVALIAGTGSQCFGKTADGRAARTAGMDFLLADQGSGYEIGRMVLRAATASYDGRAAYSVLEELVLKHFEVNDFNDLKSKVYFPVLNKGQVAELAKICIDGFEQGDATAEQILNQAINDLVVMAETVFRRLELKDADADLICSGSIARLPYVHKIVKERFAASYPKAVVQMLEEEPAYGAIKIAMQELKGAT
jgi:N-acetylglucosamine kinase-like BadF-type ATPase